MEFKEFREIIKNKFEEISKDAKILYEVDIEKDDLWSLYLDSFPAGTNEILRERREFDCSACRQFVKAFGRVVVIKDNEVQTFWDVIVPDPTYQAVAKAMADAVKSANVTGVYLSRDKQVGTKKNFEQKEGSTDVTEWNHFYVRLPDKFVNQSRDSIDTRKSEYRATASVFKRSLNEFSLDSLDTVLELIYSNTLYKGEEWKQQLVKFREYKLAYDKLSDEQKELFVWEKSVEAGPVIGRIRNHSIGTLLIDVASDMDLNQAVKKYEKVVAPTNYKRPKAIFTKKMLADAKKEVEELGYLESLPRRFSSLDDITVNNLLFSNKDAQKRIAGDVFAEMEEDIPKDPKKFKKVEEISVNKFISDVLPTAEEVELYLENKHSGNMVSLISPKNKDAPSMFKWGNSFSWAYTGNITDSTMRDRVKSAGGNVEGVLRFSIQWNEDGKDNNDLDAHCHEPNGNLISFPKKGQMQPSTGMLDVDIVSPNRQCPGQPAVENITWVDVNKMQEGTYKFLVHNYCHNGGRDGFRAEIEFDGQIYQFDYPTEMKQSEKVVVAEVTYSKATGFSIKEKLPSTLTSREIWNIKTQQFVPVSVVMYSPNYWDEQDGIGHRHYFLMLKDCINPEKPNGFYNEFLKQDLAKHKRVFEALGSRMAVTDIEDQLSGVGFSSTKRDEFIVKIKGQTERIFKVKI